MKQILLNGKPARQIDIMDRGLQYGDGLFETMRVIRGEVPLWPYHWDRLSQACVRLRLPLPDQDQLESEIRRLVCAAPQASLKLILTRGAGGRGYAIGAETHPSRILILGDVPDYPEDYRQQGVRVFSCRTRLGLNPMLAGMKHLNRLEQVLARNEWQGNDYQEGLLLDINEKLIEGTMTNLFWVKQGGLYTPDLSTSGVAGVMREFVIELAKQKAISIKIGLWPTSELLDAEEIFITNSLIGIWPVRYILNKTFAVGPVTQQLQLSLQATYAI